MKYLLIICLFLASCSPKSGIPFFSSTTIVKDTTIYLPGKEVVKYHDLDFEGNPFLYDDSLMRAEISKLNGRLKIALNLKQRPIYLPGAKQIIKVHSSVLVPTEIKHWYDPIIIGLSFIGTLAIGFIISRFLKR